MLKERTGGRFFNLNKAEEITYWQSLGGVGGTAMDAMVSYLSSQGYTGTPFDQFNAWLQAQEGTGFVGDNARKLTGT